MIKEAKHPFAAGDFRRRLRAWYRKNGRDLPWRRTRDPYAIFVSELMLQQTQVAAVISYYERWLHRFPNIESLARASEAEVLHAWQGLGYYSRARHLHAAAKILTTQRNGVFPRRTNELIRLPGAGRYTANAVATFAFDRSVPIVEANVGRVFARVFNLQMPIDSGMGRETLWEIGQMLLPKRGARIHNSALMDLGALICTAHAPKCEICPVQKFCRAKKPSVLPIKKPRPCKKSLTEFHSFSCARGRILLEQSRKRWRRLWILPPLRSKPVGQSALHVSEFPFTHHRVTLAIFETSSRVCLNGSQRWFRLNELDAVPIPSPHRRALNQLLSAV
jgi:A/G-specific adenine glycosylase